MTAKMYNLRDFLGIKRIRIIPNARVRELCGLKRGEAGKEEESEGRYRGASA